MLSYKWSEKSKYLVINYLANKIYENKFRSRREKYRGIAEGCWWGFEQLIYISDKACKNMCW